MDGGDENPIVLCCQWAVTVIMCQKYKESIAVPHIHYFSAGKYRYNIADASWKFFVCAFQFPDDTIKGEGSSGG